MAFTLPPLPYDYDALEPHYDRASLEIHHGKHHATYVEKLNKALASAPKFLAEKSLEELLADLDSIPLAIRKQVENHGGGHANHSLFWKLIGPGRGGEPTGALAEAIKAEYGSFQTFRRKFSDAAAELFGSGWTFLVEDEQGMLAIRNLPNQGSPISYGQKPLLLLDLWEHAYYLKWRNRRAEWIETWWSLVDWEEADRQYQEEPSWMHSSMA